MGLIQEMGQIRDEIDTVARGTLGISENDLGGGLAESRYGSRGTWPGKVEGSDGGSRIDWHPGWEKAVFI